LLSSGPLGAAGSAFKGHEFHYATVLEEGDEAPLFACRDAMGGDLGTVGAARGRVMGSFVHLIDRAGP
jgi:cobyrinic acid a,c-diamide synthase